MELMAVVSEPPTLKVLAGQTEIGDVPLQLLTLERPDGHRLLLAGRHWHVVDVDWRRRVVQVEPAAEEGRARWIGEGRALRFELCQGIRRVLAGEPLDGVTVSRRAESQLEAARTEFAWMWPDAETVALRSPHGDLAWWTFAGLNANSWLAVALGDLVDQVRPDDLRIRLVPHADVAELESRLRAMKLDELALGEKVAKESIDRLKFAGALPEHLARRVVERRLRDDEAVAAVAEWGVRGHQVSE